MNRIISHSENQASTESAIHNSRLNAGIAEKYRVTFRDLSPAILLDVKIKLQTTLGGDLLAIACTLLDNAIAGLPWTDVFQVHTRPDTGGNVMQSTARVRDIHHLIRSYGLGVSTCTEMVNGSAHPFYRVCFEDEVLTSDTTRNIKTGLPRVRPYSIGGHTAIPKDSPPAKDRVSRTATGHTFTPATTTPRQSAGWKSEGFSFGNPANNTAYRKPVGAAQDSLFDNFMQHETGAIHSRKGGR